MGTKLFDNLWQIAQDSLELPSVTERGQRLRRHSVFNDYVNYHSLEKWKFLKRIFFIKGTVMQVI